MKLIAIIKILRPINLIITFLSVIISAVISASFDSLSLIVILTALSVTFSFAAGNVINDVIDFEIDKINRPERVLPLGLMSLKSAKGLYFITVGISLLLSALVAVEILVIMIFLNLLLLLYSTNLKRIILLSNFVVAFATAFPLVLGGIVVENFFGGLIPAGFAFFTNFIREIIKDSEDIKGDSIIGVKTFPQQFGLDFSVALIISLIILLIVIDMLPFFYRIYSAEYFVLITILVNPLFVFVIKLLYNNKELATLRRASNLIKINMMLGLLAILIGA
ncbi:MAG: geranylgeranylglycerol-phosphate geranylgeranyltransferase [Melioribacteraceae bacterium]|nr:MAG: geranylgeranylglycerol-phosphate geranylgeranyltransferase [Melioribacteraceae bacterium]